jgi:hypothetical protein
VLLDFAQLAAVILLQDLLWLLPNWVSHLLNLLLHLPAAVHCLHRCCWTLCSSTQSSSRKTSCGCCQTGWCISRNILLLEHLLNIRLLLLLSITAAVAGSTGLCTASRSHPITRLDVAAARLGCSGALSSAHDAGQHLAVGGIRVLDSWLQCCIWRCAAVNIGHAAAR